MAELVLPWLYVAWVACQALDVGSTVAVTRSGRYAEANPFGRPAIKISINIGAALVQRKTTRHRWAIPAAAAGSGCGAAAWNLTR